MKLIHQTSVLCLVCLIWAGQLNALCVRASKANLRTGPGAKYEIGWTVFKYMPFKKVGSSVSGDWYAVEDVDGVVLWIHKDLVTKSYRCATVKSDEVNVRTGPGRHRAKKFGEPMKRYYSARVVEERRTWVKIEDADGDIGWIHRNYLWIQ